MGNKWTEPQQQAFQIHNHNVLISAGAGSGKTAVLTQRIINILSDKKNGATISQILVLTFTNKAAFEMRERIKKTLKNNSELSSISDLVDSSDITTFDAFALSIVKKYGYLLGLNNDISIVDENILRIKQNNTLDEIFMRYYQLNNDNFKDMIYKYCILDDKNIKSWILEIIRVANLKLNKKQFFDEYESNYFDNKFLSDSINEFYVNIKERIVSLRKRYLEISDPDIVQRLDDIYYTPLLNNDYNDLYCAFTDSELTKFSFPKKANSDDKEIYKSVQGELKEIRDLVKSIGNTDDIIKNETESKKYIKILIKIAEELDEKMFDYKLEQGVFTFSDIASIAYRIVKMPTVNEELKNKIKFIMIDEYQDTSDIQDAFIAELSNDNVFMVGDIKQSIYRFRNANPKLFKTNYDNYSENNGGELICFPDNFRSRKEVIDSINEIFSDIMSENNGGVNYDSNQKLRFSNILYETVGKTNQKYGLQFKEYSELDYNNISNKEIEIRLVCEDIIKKVESSYLIFDRKINQLRPCNYNDFAILIDRKTNYYLFEKIFSEYKIPLVTDDNKDVKSSLIVLVIKSILSLMKYIQNNEVIGQDFEHAFASIARSFLFNYSDELIFQIIKSKMIIESEIFKTASKCIAEARNLSLTDILIMIIREYKIYEKMHLIGDILFNQSILDNLFSLCKNMDDLRYNFSDFVQFFDDLEKFDIELKLDINVKTDEAVKIMTMHKSKGLEFHIIYCCGLSSLFDRSSYSGNYIFSSTYGFHLVNKNYKFDNYIFKYLSQNKEKKDDISEKIRLLYVCLTRAEENAIVFISKEQFEHNKKTIYDANCLITFIKGFTKYKKYVEKAEFQNIKIKDNTVCNKNDFEQFTFLNVNVVSKNIDKKRASKEISFNVDHDALNYGTHIHELLQIVNFYTKDVSFIKNDYERNLIINLINNPLFANIKDAKIMQEFDFYDDSNHVQGTIDLLLVYKDHIDIIDYKLKSIRDEDYTSQLHVYENYIIGLTNLPIKKYLISVLDGTSKEVL